MARLHLHPVGLVLLFFGLLCWVVALGGLAASTNYCQKAGTSFTECSEKYQLEWWSIWFELFLLVIMLGTCFLNAFERARFIFLAYLALVTSLLTLTAGNFITNSFKVHGGKIDFKDYTQGAYNAAAAGAVMLCITNYSLIIFVGLGAAAAQQAAASAGLPEQKYQPSNF